MSLLSKSYRKYGNTYGKLLGLLVLFVLTACSSQASQETIINADQQSAEVVVQSNAPNVQAAPQEIDQPDEANLPLIIPTAMASPAEPLVIPEQPAAQVSENQVTAETTAVSTSLPAEQAPPSATNLEVRPEVGYQAPDFSLQTLDGNTINLSALRGQPVVISYWATWCAPCKQELPILQGLAQEYGASGVQMLTVNAIEQDQIDSVQGVVGQLGLTMPVLLDQQNQFQSAYNQLFFPTSYFIDVNGVIRYIKLGDASEIELRSNVEKLINNQL